VPMSTMLPSTPKSFGDIRHVFSSGLSALLGESNYFHFRQTKQLVSILVDGLGVSNVRERSGHAPFLTAQLSAHKPISAGYPSTTATSITSFATGLQAGHHGIVGYRIQDPSSTKAVNLLTGWGDQWHAPEWQVQPTISQRAVESGVDVFFIGSPEYESSGFSSITMPNAKFVGSKSISSSFEIARQLLESSGRCLIYLYLPQLDQTAHAYGWQSDKWAVLLEQLDSDLRNFVSGLTPHQSVTLTADHGVVDISEENKVFLDEGPQPNSEITLVGGDTRAPFVYLSDPGETKNYVEKLRDYYSNIAYVLAKDELVASGWYGPFLDGIEARLPSVAILAKSKVAFYHREFSSPKSLRMIGHHGSISSEELLVPLLRFGQLA